MKYIEKVNGLFFCRNAMTSAEAETPEESKPMKLKLDENGHAILQDGMPV